MSPSGLSPSLEASRTCHLAQLLLLATPFLQVSPRQGGTRQCLCAAVKFLRASSLNEPPAPFLAVCVTSPLCGLPPSKGLAWVPFSDWMWTMTQQWTPRENMSVREGPYESKELSSVKSEYESTESVSSSDSKTLSKRKSMETQWGLNSRDRQECSQPLTNFQRTDSKQCSFVQKQNSSASRNSYKCSHLTWVVTQRASGGGSKMKSCVSQFQKSRCSLTLMPMPCDPEWLWHRQVMEYVVRNSG